MSPFLHWLLFFCHYKIVVSLIWRLEKASAFLIKRLLTGVQLKLVMLSYDDVAEFVPYHDNCYAWVSLNGSSETGSVLFHFTAWWLLRCLKTSHHPDFFEGRMVENVQCCEWDSNRRPRLLVATTFATELPQLHSISLPLVSGKKEMNWGVFRLKIIQNQSNFKDFWQKKQYKNLWRQPIWLPSSFFRNFMLHLAIKEKGT